MIARLEEGLCRLGLELSERQKDSLCQYIGQVLEFNKGYNLMKAANEDEMAANHVLDSLAALPHIEQIARDLSQTADARITIGDIGSGGGCPGIPLAIAAEGFDFALVERMEKRCAFLESVIKSLSLKNARVVPLQAEKVPKASFDIEVFRAFHPFDKKLAKTLFSMLKQGGYIAAYKARSEKIAAEMEAVRGIIPEYKKIPLTVPFLEDHERNLIVIRKK